MPQENFANDIATTLNGAISASQTSIVVLSATGFPAANFRIRIENEILIVTAVAGTTWTVTRGAESTTAAIHGQGAAVVHVLTAGGLAQALADLLSGSPVIGGSVFVGDTSNAFSGQGVTVNQGANDDEIVAYKSSDVAHGITTSTETDTFGTVKKEAATTGGVAFRGYSSGTTGMRHQGIGTTNDTTKSTAGIAGIVLVASKKSGTSQGANDANANLLAIYDHGSARFLFDADGDSHQDVGTAWTNFHGHDDLALIEALAANVTRADDPIRNDFGKFLFEKRADLERLRLVSFNDEPGQDGRPFVNMSRLTMLLVGALQQVSRRFLDLEASISGIRSDLQELRAGS